MTGVSRGAAPPPRDARHDAGEARPQRERARVESAETAG